MAGQLTEAEVKALPNERLITLLIHYANGEGADIAHGKPVDLLDPDYTLVEQEVLSRMTR